MVKASEYIGGSWVKADDLDGEDVTVTIEAVSVESFDDDGKERLVLQFVGMKKKLGLNTCNTETLMGLYGDETDDWIGCNCTLYPTTTRMEGKTVPCVRIRDSRPEEEPLPIAKPAPAAASKGKRKAAVKF